MAVYFIPKNRLFSGNISSVNFTQSKWATRWITVYKSSSNSTNLPSNGKKIHSRFYSAKQVNDTKAGAVSKKATGGWLTWRNLILKWTPIGIGLASLVHWHLHYRKCDELGQPRTASRFMTEVYCSLPLRLISRTWGWLADCRVPMPFRPVVYGVYSTAFGVNIEEAENSNFKDYRSISEFFTRQLRPGVRTISSKSCMVSPVDGRVLHFGLADGHQIEQVKGMNYSLKEFLGPSNYEKTEKSATINFKHKRDEETNLYQCVIYLAPGDYHRFHSPTEWKPVIRRHFHGELLSVNPNIAKWLPGLFCLNERVVYIGQWDHGFCSFTAVGATNVGSVDVYIDKDLKTNKWVGFRRKSNQANQYDEIQLPANTILQKGEILGQFNMGSTVVLIFEAPKKFRFFISNGQKVRLGEPLGCINDLDESKMDETTK
ncbi:phosphatidylserine decarboxylase proenzyme, mitochondrial isoform X2 [Sitodiplosis mosellana]|uniref:phosphatidylserine decarboxylase proenzyme, mitochondrial isoform X2 n=1 Tax=Sitodiplosis mosellana TaxID=263140 RepID=UPI002443A483|nr:phosphatidylserine decarboxylase proenzyme, mitochondrial isoform X2 [Sitodiplosis mosellana]